MSKEVAAWTSLPLSSSLNLNPSALCIPTPFAQTTSNASVFRGASSAMSTAMQSPTTVERSDEDDDEDGGSVIIRGRELESGSD